MGIIICMEKDKKNIKYHNPEYLPVGCVSLDANLFSKEKSEAEYYLGHLQGSSGDGLGKRFFNADLLVSPLATKEAVTSSKIEGTISTVSDVYKYEAGETPEYSGTAEVANYKKAIKQAITIVQEGKKINKNYLKILHKTLLTGVRHKGLLGDFRKRDVWIGEKENDPIERAIYVPPLAIRVEEYIDDLFRYIENGTEDPLTKAALAHYQFEAVHPFEDGNGRVGRLLIPLILFANKKMSLPILYMSGYFDAHRDAYRSALHEVDETLKYEGWLKFFFYSASKQSQETLSLFTEINKLYEETKGLFTASTRSPYLLPFLGYIFEHPIFYQARVAEKMGATPITVGSLIKTFEEKGVITQRIPEDGSDRRIKGYSFNNLLELLTQRP